MTRLSATGNQAVVIDPPCGGDKGYDHQLVTLVFSRMIAASRARTDSIVGARLCGVLSAYARTALVGEGASPPPHPDILDGPWPHDATTLRRIGMTPREIHDQYADLVFGHGWTATLTDELLVSFVPRELWQVAGTILKEGPERASQRAHRAVVAYSRRTVRGNKKRPPGAPAQSSIITFRDGFHRLFEQFVELRRLGHSNTTLAPWVARPTIPVPDVGIPRQKTHAPRPERTRGALAKFDRDVADELRIVDRDDELEAIASLTVNQLYVSGKLFRLLRDRATFVVLVLTGGRISAIAALRRRDYVRDHVGVSPDHRCGPALLLKPGKSLHPDLVRPKLLPEGAARVLDSYLLFLERQTPVLYRYFSKTPGRRVGHPELPADFPLLVSDRTSFRPFGKYGIRSLLSGVRPTKSSGGRRPVILREDNGGGEEYPPEHRHFLGYTPHEYRHACAQFAERAGEIWNDRHPPSAGSPLPEPSLFASALLDHQPPGDPIRNLYGDRGTDAAYELLAGRAMAVMWELLTTDVGIRKRPNLPTLRERIAELHATEGEIVFRQRALDVEYQRTLAPPPERIPAPVVRSQISVDERLTVLTGMVGVLLERQDLHLQREHEHHERLVGLQRMHDELWRLAQHRSEVHQDVLTLWHDQDHWEVVPDLAPAGAHRFDTTLAELLAEGHEHPRELAASAEVRNWLTAGEFALGCGMRGRSTVARWLRGEHLPSDASKRPWEPDAIPVDDSLGLKYRRIWLGGVNPKFFATRAERERVASMLRGWPQERGWCVRGEPGPRCTAPLIIAHAG